MRGGQDERAFATSFDGKSRMGRHSSIVARDPTAIFDEIVTYTN